MAEKPTWLSRLLQNPPGGQTVKTIFDKKGNPIGISVNGGKGPILPGSADYDPQTQVDFGRDEPEIVIKPKKPQQKGGNENG